MFKTDQDDKLFTSSMCLFRISVYVPHTDADDVLNKIEHRKTIQNLDFPYLLGRPQETNFSEMSTSQQDENSYSVGHI